MTCGGEEPQQHRDKTQNSQRDDSSQVGEELSSLRGRCLISLDQMKKREEGDEACFVCLATRMRGSDPVLSKPNGWWIKHGGCRKADLAAPVKALQTQSCRSYISLVRHLSEHVWAPHVVGKATCEQIPWCYPSPAVGGRPLEIGT